MARKNKAFQRKNKNKDYGQKAEGKLSAVSLLHSLTFFKEINRNIEEQMLGLAAGNKVHMNIVKSQQEMKLAAKKAKQHQKALNAKV